MRLFSHKIIHDEISAAPKAPFALLVSRTPDFTPKRIVQWLIERVRGPHYGCHPTLAVSVREALRSQGLKVKINPMFSTPRPPALFIAFGSENALAYCLNQAKESDLVLSWVIPEDSPTQTSFDTAKVIFISHPKPNEREGTSISETSSSISHIRWWAGVNTQYWHPTKVKRTTPLIYFKTPLAPESELETTRQTLANLGFQTEVVRYGNYSKAEYRSALRKAPFAVIIGAAETQGIALAEAWACDTPTFVWQNLSLLDQLSPAPLLTKSTGYVWTTNDELTSLIKSWESGRTNFEPRLWCLENLSFEKTGQALLDLIFQATRKTQDN